MTLSTKRKTVDRPISNYCTMDHGVVKKIYFEQLQIYSTNGDRSQPRRVTTPTVHYPDGSQPRRVSSPTGHYPDGWLSLGSDATAILTTGGTLLNRKNKKINNLPLNFTIILLKVPPHPPNHIPLQFFNYLSLSALQKFPKVINLANF